MFSGSGLPPFIGSHNQLAWHTDPAECMACQLRCSLHWLDLLWYLPYSSRVEWTLDSSSSSSPASLCRLYFLCGLYTSCKTPNSSLKPRKCFPYQPIIIVDEQQTHQNIQHCSDSLVFLVEKLFILHPGLNSEQQCLWGRCFTCGRDISIFLVTSLWWLDIYSVPQGRCIYLWEAVGLLELRNGVRSHIVAHLLPGLDSSLHQPLVRHEQKAEAEATVLIWFRLLRPSHTPEVNSHISNICQNP